jgi:AbiU2
LRTWLRTIEANVDLFDQQGFRERLKANPFVDSLSKSARKPDAAILTADVNSVSRKSDALVAKLCDLRNRLLAHRNASLVLGATVLNAGGIRHEDIDELLDRAVALVNRYSSLFRAQTYSTNIVGRDDYESMLRFVRRGINAYEAEIEAEIDEAQRNAGGGGPS